MLDELGLDICDYIARETQDNLDRGMSPEEARYAKTRKFGIGKWFIHCAEPVWAWKLKCRGA